MLFPNGPQSYGSLEDALLDDEATGNLLGRLPVKRRDCQAFSRVILVVSAFLFCSSSVALAVGASIWRNVLMLFVVVPAAILLNFVSLALLAIIYLARAPEETSKRESVAALAVSILGFVDAAAIVPLSFRALAGVSVPGFSGSVLSAPSELVRLIVMSAWVGLAVSAVRARVVGGCSLSFFCDASFLSASLRRSWPKWLLRQPSCGRTCGWRATAGRSSGPHFTRFSDSRYGWDCTVSARAGFHGPAPSHPAPAETKQWQC